MESNQSLDGIKVIDCSQILAGPFCSMLLADHGADVIKIEKPNGGDDVRTWGPPFIGKDSSAFVQLNRNKRSISLYIKSQEGIIILKSKSLKKDFEICKSTFLNAKNININDKIKDENNILVLPLFIL